MRTRLKEFTILKNRTKLANRAVTASDVYDCIAHVVACFIAQYTVRVIKCLFIYYLSDLFILPELHHSWYRRHMEMTYNALSWLVFFQEGLFLKLFSDMSKAFDTVNHQIYFIFLVACLKVLY